MSPAYFIEKLAQYTSVLLLLLFVVCGSGCAVKYLNLNDIPEVITIAEDMSKDDAVAKISHIVGQSPGTHDVTSYGIEFIQYAPILGREIRRIETRRTLYEKEYTVFYEVLGKREYGKTLPFSDIRGVVTINNLTAVKDRNASMVKMYTANRTPFPFNIILPSSLTNFPYLVIMDECQVNDFLAALYVLCPKLQ